MPNPTKGIFFIQLYYTIKHVKEGTKCQELHRKAKKQKHIYGEAGKVCDASTSKTEACGVSINLCLLGKNYSTLQNLSREESYFFPTVSKVNPTQQENYLGFASLSLLFVIKESRPVL